MLIVDQLLLLDSRNLVMNRTAITTLSKNLKQVESKSAGKLASSTKKRFFDDHTICIWARNMVERGGRVEEAVQTLLNRADAAIAHGRCSQAMYNAAIDICGHRGNLVEAGSIFSQVCFSV